jgi:hypothetical protein
MRGEELELEVDDLPARLAGADLRLTPPPRVSASYSILVALDQLASRDDRGVRPTHLVLCAAVLVLEWTVTCKTKTLIMETRRLRRLLMSED